MLDHTLIYILGSGRSGSTLLERVLNTHPEVFAVGEIHALWRLPLHELVCSCGTSIMQCPFWQEVLAVANLDAAQLARLAFLEREFVRNRHLFKLRFDLSRIAADQHIKEFCAVQDRLFSAIRQVSRCRHIVDSSKAGPRAWALTANMAITLLYLHRDARSVLASWRKPKRESATGTIMQTLSCRRAAADWLKVAQTANMLHRRTRLRTLDYQQLALAPRATLGQVLPEFAEQLHWINDSSVQPAEHYHSVLGNPDRFDSGPISIRPRHAADRAQFSRFEAAKINWIGNCLNHLYPAPAMCADAPHGPPGPPAP